MNSYDILKSEPKNEEKQFYEPIDIVYEPVNGESSVKCFFTDNLHLAYRSYCSKPGNNNAKFQNMTARQCYYCGKYIVHYGTFKKHIKSCSDIAGVVYKFENNKIITFQDNFKFMGDLPFTVYFDFETTKGDNILHDSKMFVISHCQIYDFYPDLKLDKIVIFRSFQQAIEKILALLIFHMDMCYILIQLQLTS